MKSELEEACQVIVSTLSHILKIFWQHGFCDCFCIEKRSLKASVMPEDLNI